MASLSVLVATAQYLKIEYAGDALPKKEQQLVEQMMVYQIKFYRLFGLKDSLKVKLTVFNERSVAEFYLDTIGLSKKIRLKTSVVYIVLKEKRLLSWRWTRTVREAFL